MNLNGRWFGLSEIRPWAPLLVNKFSNLRGVFCNGTNFRIRAPLFIPNPLHLWSAPQKLGRRTKPSYKFIQTLNHHCAHARLYDCKTQAKPFDVDRNVKNKPTYKMGHKMSNLFLCAQNGAKVTHSIIAALRDLFFRYLVNLFSSATLNLNN